MDRDGRLRHGAPGGVRSGRLRSRALHRFRVGHRYRARRDSEVSGRGHPALLRKRSPISRTVPVLTSFVVRDASHTVRESSPLVRDASRPDRRASNDMRLVLSWLREFVDVSAPAEEIAEKVGLRGFEVASIEKLDDGDAVIDFEITANRPDCLSVLGLAREVATVYDQPLVLPSTEPGAKIALKTVTIGSSDRVTVTIEDADLCPRYAAAVAEVKIGTSPAWMTDR